MNEHTPEPWPEFEQVAMKSKVCDMEVVELGKENYNRARACVNACAGVTFAGNIDTTGMMVEDNRRIMELEQQRDELLALNAELADAATHYREHSQPSLPHGHDAEDRLVIAIAKARWKHD